MIKNTFFPCILPNISGKSFKFDIPQNLPRVSYFFRSLDLLKAMFGDFEPIVTIKNETTKSCLLPILPKIYIAFFKVTKLRSPVSYLFVDPSFSGFLSAFDGQFSRLMTWDDRQHYLWYHWGAVRAVGKARSNKRQKHLIRNEILFFILILSKCLSKMLTCRYRFITHIALNGWILRTHCLT